MRKYLIGFMAGAAIMASFNVSAAVESLIGKQIQGEAPVVLNEQKLDTKGAILDGTTYVPVRAISEALGLDVDFKEGTVVLESGQEEAPPVETTTPETTTPATPPATTDEEPVKQLRSIEQVESDIRSVKVNIWAAKASIETTKEGDPNLKKFQDRLAKYEQELADLETELATLQP